jgi:hypothetical protein
VWCGSIELDIFPMSDTAALFVSSALCVDAEVVSSEVVV